MLEVYVESVEFENGFKKNKAKLHLSTEIGKHGTVDFSERNEGKDGLIARCLSKYSSGMYSAEKNKFVAECDVTEDMQGYEPYHLNYCPEYVERECACCDGMISGYRFGSLNPINGGKVKAVIMDVMHYIDEHDKFVAEIAFYDNNDCYLDVYPVACDKVANRNEFLVESMKRFSTNYFYSVDEGYWDLYADGETPTSTFYGIDFDIDEEEVMDFDLTVEGEE